MTIEEKLKSMLTERGMFENQAEEVLAELKKSKDCMATRWTDGIEGYPSQLLNVLWIVTKRLSSEHIEKHCPQAWFKPMFI